MAANTPPTFGGSLGNTITLAEGAGFTVLDPTVTISDTELDAAGNYARASVTIQRSGTASLDDSFAMGSSFQFAAEGGAIALTSGTPGLIIGTVTRNSRGVLTLTFNENATQDLVELALSQVTYRNTSNDPPASVDISWVFSDGNKGAQGTGGAQTASGITTVNINAINEGGHFGFAGTGDDVISGTDSIDNLDGQLGDDVLYGAGGDDALRGSAGTDELYGEDGNDNLVGGLGADSLDGGTGLDYAYYSDSSAGVVVDLSTGKGARGDAQGDTYLSIENVWGSIADDQIKGNAGTNTFAGSWGNDTYDGAGGADRYQSFSPNWSVEIAFGARAQELATALGATLGIGYGIAVKTSNDLGIIAPQQTYDLLLGIDNFSGGIRNDTIAGNDANNTIYASGGVDILSGGGGFDYVIASGAGIIDLQAGTLTGTGTATISGFEGAIGGIGVNTLLGDAGANRLEGRDDNDNLAGRAGNDHLLGGNGNDLMRGEAGNDIMEGGAGGDLLDGGVGVDWASYLDSETEVQVDLLAGRGGGTALDSTGDRYINIENVVGSEQDDTIGGNNSENILVGNKGSDEIEGCGGDDVIYGDVYPVALGVLAASDYLTALEDASKVDCGCGDEDGGDDGDTFTISNMIDDLQGGDGDDRLYGQGGTDLLRGDCGDDFLSGGNQLDLLFGGDDDDTLDGGGGADFLFGGAGFDIASYATSQAAVSVDLSKPFSGVGGDAESDLITELLSQVLTSTDIGSTFISSNFTALFALINSALDTGTGRSLFTLSDMLSSIEGLQGSKFNDHLTGDSADNSLMGGLGADVLDGGLGVDLGDYSDKSASVAVTLAGAADVTVFIGGVAEDTIRSIEDLAGGSAADSLTGDGLANFLFGGGGNDTLVGGNGNDELVGGTGKDTLDGSAGTDTADYGEQTRSVVVALAGASNATVKINGTAEDILRNIENVIGGAGGDTLTGDGANNVLTGGAGDDTLRGGGGADVLDGQDGSDTADYGDKNAAVRVTLKGASNATVAVGGVNEDTIRGIENLIGGSAADQLTGDGLANRLVGGSGDDTLRGGDGRDTLDGGQGLDTADYRDKSAGVRISLRGASSASAFVDGIAEDSVRNVENVIGGSGQDFLTGDDLANVLDGGSDNDQLDGGANNDTLIGGAGADVLAGGAGNDSLTGGAGVDGFLFDTALNASTNLDTVADFNATDDSIALAKSIFKAFASTGTIDAAAFFVGNAAHDASDRIIYNSLTGGLFYDSNGSATGGSVQFAQLATGLALTNQDFIVV